VKEKNLRYFLEWWIFVVVLSTLSFVLPPWCGCRACVPLTLCAMLARVSLSARSPCGHPTTALLTRYIPGSWIGLPNSQTFPSGMFFGNCPQKFRTFTGHLWKVTKAQKFAPPSSAARESARVGLTLVADQTSACRFACTLSSCNLQCFKYS